MAPAHTRSKTLRSLGAAKTMYRYDKPDPKLLEKFLNPMFMYNSDHADASICIAAPEFTSLCPKTGQPDFATIEITYVPHSYCVESKSLKLYLGSFRNYGEFHEECVARILNDLVALLDPVSMTVVGRFTPRGGIPFWPSMTWRNPRVKHSL